MTAMARDNDTSGRAPRAPRARWAAGRSWWAGLSWTGRVAAVVVLAAGLIVVFGAAIAPYSATDLNPEALLVAPSADHLLGTDNYGRDVFSRILVGGRATLLLALLCTISSMIVGAIVGITSGYIGGTYDMLVMRIADVLQSIPSLLIALLVLAVFGSSIPILVLAITLVFFPPIARIARTAALQVAKLPFTEAAKVRGEGTLSIVFREVLPNAAPTLLTEAGLRFSHSLLTLAALGFLGLGVQPPTPDWGLMVNEGRAYMSAAPWVVLAPAAAIALVVLAVNVVIDESKGGRA